jgi:hypothetical protein
VITETIRKIQQSLNEDALVVREKKEEKSRNEALPICTLNGFRINEIEVQEDLKIKSSECGPSDFARLIDPGINLLQTET